MRQPVFQKDLHLGSSLPSYLMHHLYALYTFPLSLTQFRSHFNHSIYLKCPESFLHKLSSQLREAMRTHSHQEQISLLQLERLILKSICFSPARASTFLLFYLLPWIQMCYLEVCIFVVTIRWWIVKEDQGNNFLLMMSGCLHQQMLTSWIVLGKK